jgi:hypothetical protein
MQSIMSDMQCSVLKGSRRGRIVKATMCLHHATITAVEGNRQWGVAVTQGSHDFFNIQYPIHISRAAGSRVMSQ